MSQAPRAHWQLLDRTATLSAILASAAIVWGLYSGRFEERHPLATAPRQIEDISSQQLTVDLEGLPRQGTPTAAVVVMEFADFECSFCSQHARDVYPEIKRDYVDSGRVQYVFRHLPLDGLHPLARTAAVTSACAMQQERFWDVHDRLFAAPRALSVGLLHEYARVLVLDPDAFDICLHDGIGAELVARDEAVAKELGITGTPTFVIGELSGSGATQVLRKVTGLLSYVAFAETLDDVLRSR